MAAEAKTIKGGTLRLVDINNPKEPELFETNKVLYQMGYFFHFAEPENGVKSFRKVYFGDKLLEIAKVLPDAEFKMVYPVIKFGYDFIAEMQGIPNSQCQKKTNYFIHTDLIIDQWKTILKSDKKVINSTLSPIEDLQSKQISWCITNIQWD